MFATGLGKADITVMNSIRVHAGVYQLMGERVNLTFHQSEYACNYLLTFLHQAGVSVRVLKVDS